MPLICAPQGETFRVVRVLCDEKLRKHLESLGIIAGARLTPLSRSSGNMIVRLSDARFAINYDVAKSIIVAA